SELRGRGWRKDYGAPAMSRMARAPGQGWWRAGKRAVGAASSAGVGDLGLRFFDGLAALGQILGDLVGFGAELGFLLLELGELRARVGGRRGGFLLRQLGGGEGEAPLLIAEAVGDLGEGEL